MSLAPKKTYLPTPTVSIEYVMPKHSESKTLHISDEYVVELEALSSGCEFATDEDPENQK